MTTLKSLHNCLIFTYMLVCLYTDVLTLKYKLLHGVRLSPSSLYFPLFEYFIVFASTVRVYSPECQFRTT